MDRLRQHFAPQPSSTMASSPSRQQTFPAAPPTLSAGDHEMRDYYAFQTASRPPSNQAPYLTPYLGLRARLSQVWINRWTILLILVLVRTLLAIGGLNQGLASARKGALSACTSVEDVGSHMASMPHYMSQGVNRLTAESITKAVGGLTEMVTLSITGVEEMILFVIGMITSAFLSLLTLAASGGAEMASNLAQEISGAVNSTLAGIDSELSDGVSSFQQDLNNFLSVLPGLPNVSGGPPSLNLTSQLDKLKSVKLPDDIDQKILQLNASIPSFSDVQNSLNDQIRQPLDDLKTLIDQKFGNYSFDGTLLPVPEKESLTFCSGNNAINDFFDNLDHVSHVARNIFLGVLLTAAILVCLPVAWWEIQRWRRLQRQASRIGQEAIDPMDTIYVATRPHTAHFGHWLSSKSGSHRTRIIIRWTIAYCTSVPALFVLALALAGFFACLCQFILLKSIQREVPALAAEVGDFSQKVVDSLNNASAAWANKANGLVGETSDDINQHLLSWANTSTTAVNNTLNDFVNQSTTVIQKAFGDTIIADALQDVFGFLNDLKERGIESGLNWVHEHAHVTFPSLPNDTFTLQKLASHTDTTADDNFLADPKDATADEVTGAIDSLVNLLMSGVRLEAIISTMILLLWILVAFMGFIRACWLYLKHDKMRAEGGNEFPNVPPFGNSDPPNDNFDVKQIEVPSYEAATSDVNPHAPYTLNPHPFPQAESPHGGADLEKGPHHDVRNYTRTVTPDHLDAHKSMHGAIVNEKNGVDPFADYRPNMI